MSDDLDAGTDHCAGGSDDCLHCWGTGVQKRRYGTVGPGPAKIVKKRPCPNCEGTGTVRKQDTDTDRNGGN